MEKPLPVHEGSEPYIFVSYSRNDADIVFPEIRWLQQQGVNVWYDVGIRPGSEWSDTLANKIAGCSGFLFFITPQSVASENCRRELNFALEEDRQVLAAHLTDTDLPRGIRLSLNNRQAVIRSRFEQQAFREMLLAFARQQTLKAAPRTDPVSSTVSDTRRGVPGWLSWTIGVGLAIAAAVGALLFWRHAVDERWATQDMLPVIHKDIAADDLGPAFTVAEAIEKRLGANYVPPDVWEQVATKVSIDSAPEGARVSYRQYAESNAAWVELGETPVHVVRLPRTMLLLKAEKPGYATAYRISDSPGVYLRNEAAEDKLAVRPHPGGRLPTPQAIELVASNAQPAEMVWIPASEIPAFLIDRYETTNRDYQAFVDAGGYADTAYWRDLGFAFSGHAVDWQSAVARFVDATGHAGPASWELGKYPEGDADLPVTGVSWYEAAAYARYRGKSLPTVHHWRQAASAGIDAFGGSLVNLSNFGGRLREIGSTTAMGPYGAYDLLGNAREWTANASGADRVVIGGAESDAPYTAFAKLPASPWDRSNLTGIRCVIYLEPVSAALIADVPIAPKMPPVPQAASEELVDAIIGGGNFLAFDSDGMVLEERQLSGSRIRRVSLRTGLADERFDVYAVIPDGATPPYQTLIYMGGTGFESKAKIDADMDWEVDAVFSPILRTGRVVIWPTWYGSFTRYDGVSERSPNEVDAAWAERGRRWRRETAAVLDYVASSAQFSDKIGWLGLSLGAHVPVEIPGFFGPQFKCAILVSGGMDVVDAPWKVTHYRRMKLPALMLNGRYDQIIPIERAQRFYELYGAPPEDKRQVIYDAEHWPLPRNQIAREMSAWLDRYLGPVGAPVRTARIPVDE